MIRMILLPYIIGISIITFVVYLMGPNCDPRDLKMRITKDEVRKLCGNPTLINYSGSMMGTDEQWMYRPFGTLFYFHNENLTGYN